MLLAQAERRLGVADQLARVRRRLLSSTTGSRTTVPCSRPGLLHADAFAAALGVGLPLLRGIDNRFGRQWLMRELGWERPPLLSKEAPWKTPGRPGLSRHRAIPWLIF